MSGNSQRSLKRLKIKTCSADRITPTADPIWAKLGGNDRSKHCEWHWWARSAVTAEKQGDISLLIGWDGDDITQWAGTFFLIYIFTAALLTARDRGSVEFEAVGVYFNVSNSAECQKRTNLTADPAVKVFSAQTFRPFPETDSTDRTELVKKVPHQRTSVI